MSAGLVLLTILLWVIMISTFVIFCIGMVSKNDPPIEKSGSDRWAPMFGVTPGNWFLWFAWRPVQTLDRGLVWMRPVWKRRAYKKSGLPGPSLEWWQYVVER